MTSFSAIQPQNSPYFFIYLLFGNHSWQPKRVHFIFFLTNTCLCNVDAFG